MSHIFLTQMTQLVSRGVKLQGKVTETKAEDKTCDRTLANVLP